MTSIFYLESKVQTLEEDLSVLTEEINNLPSDTGNSVESNNSQKHLDEFNAKLSARMEVLKSVISGKKVLMELKHLAKTLQDINIEMESHFEFCKTGCKTASTRTGMCIACDIYQTYIKFGIDATHEFIKIHYNTKQD